MFGELEVSFANLDDTTRAELAEVLRLRHELQLHQLKLTELRLAAAHHPTPANEEAINDYTTMFIVPSRQRTSEATIKLIKANVDMEKLQDMLPMAAAALMSAVNLPVVLLAASLDPDKVKELVATLREFFQEGLDSNN